MILCDIGNSTFHFLIDNDDFKISINDNLEKLEGSCFENKSIYFISVNDDAKKTFKKRFPNSIDLGIDLKFQTTYSNRLGIDRKVASKFLQDGIVVDFGSAITVDLVENYIHQGGFILTGFDSLITSYKAISNKLNFNFKQNLNIDELPKNTDEAISYGIIKMVTLPIIEYQQKYNKKLIITGETSKYFHQYFTNFEYKKRLIFENMKQIIEEQK